VLRRTELNLELATVVACDDTGCRVQLIESNQTITATFSAKVRDNIRIRQRQLVAVDTSVSPPEITWRWFIGEVEWLDETSVSVRRLDRSPGDVVAISNADRIPVAIGDVVYYGHGEAFGLVSREVDGRPENVAGLASRYLPEARITLESLNA
jgi:hypothetical protein